LTPQSSWLTCCLGGRDLPLRSPAAVEPSRTSAREASAASVPDGRASTVLVLLLVGCSGGRRTAARGSGGRLGPGRWRPPPAPPRAGLWRRCRTQGPSVRASREGGPASSSPSLSMPPHAIRFQLTSQWENMCPALRRPSPVPSSAVRVSDCGGGALHLVCPLQERASRRTSRLAVDSLTWLQRGETQRLLPPRRKNTDASAHSSVLFSDHFYRLDFTCC
jgi:hypothetical protein